MGLRPLANGLTVDGGQPSLRSFDRPQVGRLGIHSAEDGPCQSLVGLCAQAALYLPCSRFKSRKGAEDLGHETRSTSVETARRRITPLPSSRVAPTPTSPITGGWHGTGRQRIMCAWAALLGRIASSSILCAFRRREGVVACGRCSPATLCGYRHTLRSPTEATPAEVIAIRCIWFGGQFVGFIVIIN